MKKTMLLNAAISDVIARLGHGDSICVGDAGLPIPNGVPRIDLAVSKGCPVFLDVLGAVTSELFVERALLASELEARQPDMHARVTAALTALDAAQGNGIAVDAVPHEDFKARSAACKAVIRTGEFTPYSNIILISGVPF